MAGQDGVAGGFSGSPAHSVTEFTAFSGGALRSSSGHRFSLLSGSFAQEGGRPGGSLIRDAPQQPGRRWQRTPPLPGVTGAREQPAGLGTATDHKVGVGQPPRVSVPSC